MGPCRRISSRQGGSFRSAFVWGFTFSSSSRRLLIAFQEAAGDPYTIQLLDLTLNPAQPLVIRSFRVQPQYPIALERSYLVAQPFDGGLTTFDTETLHARWSSSRETSIRIGLFFRRMDTVSPPKTGVLR